MCTEAVLSLLMENVTIWGWDLTYSSNKQRFLEMVSRHFGSVAASTVRNFGVERLPLVILIAKLRGNMEIFQVIHGNVTLDEFMSSLMSANESYQSQLSVEKYVYVTYFSSCYISTLSRAEEMERNSRNQVKDEQELAFQEAQLRDQQREVKIVITLHYRITGLLLSGHAQGAGGGTEITGPDSRGQEEVGD